MPQTQVAVRAVIDFEAPAVARAVVGFRTRNNRGGKVHLHFENPITDTGQNPTQGNPNEAKNLVVSVQRAPATADGEPGTFTATTAALNLEAVTGVTIGPGQSRDYTILVRPGQDVFLALLASGGTRGQLIITGDDILDRWRAPEGSPADGSGRFDGVGDMTTV